jgi:hypothetical protein
MGVSEKWLCEERPGELKNREKGEEAKKDFETVARFSLFVSIYIPKKN